MISHQNGTMSWSSFSPGADATPLAPWDWLPGQCKTSIEYVYGISVCIYIYIIIIIMCIYIYLYIYIYIYDISLPDTVYDIWYDCKFNTLTDMKINGAALHYPTCEHFAFVTCTFWAHEKWGKCFFVRATNPLAFWSLALFVTCTFWAHEKWGKCFFVRATNPLAFWSLALYPLAYSQTL